MNERTDASNVEDYTSYVWIGLILTILLFVGLVAYWLSDSARITRAAEELSSERISRGENFYTVQCIACHGLDGEGGVGPVLNDRALLKNTMDDVFYSVIRSGVPNTQMPAWGVDFGGPLTDEDVRDVVAYMKAWEPNAPEIGPLEYISDPSRGAVLFSTTCAVCHGRDGKGGREGIPVINDPERLAQFEDEWYRNVIANGRPAKGMPTWGTVLSPAQMDDLVALIDAWRGGQVVAPSFSDTDMLERAYFALAGGDTDSARLHLENALLVTTGAGSQVLVNILTQLDNGALEGAQATIDEIKSQWPLGDPASGALIYTDNCAVCHGPQGKGGVGNALQNSAYIQSQSNAELVKFILEGRLGTAMAGFEERLSQEEIANVVSFLRLWQE